MDRRPCLFVPFLCQIIFDDGVGASRLIHYCRSLADLLSAFDSTKAARAFAADLSAGENVVVPLIANSLEWALSSPPPLHQFTEPPLVVETDHLDINPGKEVEEILAAQGHQVTDIIGKEKWVLNDPALYEGLIPQNEEWTEFVDEKTGAWVTLDEYGQKVSK
jgi:hypothetical protein